MVVDYLKMCVKQIGKKAVYALQVDCEKTSLAIRRIIRIMCNKLGKQLELVYSVSFEVPFLLRFCPFFPLGIQTCSYFFISCDFSHESECLLNTQRNV